MSRFFNSPAVKFSPLVFVLCGVPVWVMDCHFLCGQLMKTMTVCLVNVSGGWRMLTFILMVHLLYNHIHNNYVNSHFQGEPGLAVCSLDSMGCWNQCLRAGYSSCHPTNSVKAVNGRYWLLY